MSAAPKPAAAAAQDDAPIPPPQTPFRRFVSDFMESPLAVLGLIVSSSFW